MKSTLWGIERLTALGLTTLAALFFMIGLWFPIVFTDFSVERVEKLNQIEELTDNPCEKLKMIPLASEVKTVIASACDMTVNTTDNASQDYIFDRTLGPIDGASWAMCIESKGEALMKHSTYIDIPDEPMQRCFKLWTHHTLGIPLGESYLLGVVADLYQGGELLLMLMIILFTILLPISKMIMGFLLLISTQRQTARQHYGWLERLSKWSLIDVFVLAQFVILFKLKSSSLTVEASSGFYFFVTSIILMSLATWQMKKYIERESVL